MCRSDSGLFNRDSCVADPEHWGGSSLGGRGGLWVRTAEIEVPEMDIQAETAPPIWTKEGRVGSQEPGKGTVLGEGGAGGPVLNEAEVTPVQCRWGWAPRGPH